MASAETRPRDHPMKIPFSLVRHFTHSTISFASLAALALCTIARAADINSSYTGATNGVWGTAANWTPGIVPMNAGTDTFNVTIPNKKSP